MSGFKESEIGLIPEDWEISTLEKECDIIMGQSPPSTTYSKFPEGLPFYQGKADFGYLNPVNRIYCKSPIRIGEANDIIMSVRAPVGDINILTEKSCLGRGLGAIRAKAFSNFMFIYYFLLYRKEFISSLGTGSTFKSINKSQLVTLPIIKIENAEQTKIAKVLFLIQTKIIKQTQIIQNLQEVKKALMQKLFTEGLNSEPLKDTEIGKIPVSWEVVTFDDLLELKRGKDLPKAKFVKGEFPVAGSNGVIGYHNAYTHAGNGVTVGRSGSVGRVNFFNTNFWAHNTVLVVHDYKDNNEVFLYYYLEFLNLKRFASGVSVPTLNRNVFRNLKVIKPPISEQIEIGQSLNNMDIKIDSTTKKLNTLGSLFESLLNQLMTGKLRVKDLEI